MLGRQPATASLELNHNDASGHRGELVEPIDKRDREALWAGLGWAAQGRWLSVHSFLGRASLVLLQTRCVLS